MDSLFEILCIVRIDLEDQIFLNSNKGGLNKEGYLKHIFILSILSNTGKCVQI